MDHLVDAGWGPIFEDKSRANVGTVRAFYTHIRESTLEPLQFKILVGRREATVDVGLIARLLGMPLGEVNASEKSLKRVFAQSMGVAPPASPMYPAGNASVSGTFERFQRLWPPTFAEQMELVTHMFEKEARLWWDSVLRTIVVGYLWTWEAFETRFNEKYFPLTYRHEKEGEFLRLR
ncbi:uncharacterized protein LOC131228818 [Magnolia sinica]|uniref:uncharacterized protein LOC131228818 n=1 Tax=Magnolia sinica TaxID=86752 RepID=UPI00265B0A05|nr:uncharacterized protein LOC131228818 [Magnolia sinica]